jgi:S-adenosylmethionine:tRNA ribosyltransferase-isomerase
MRRTDFHFDLPRELIAQRPTATRSASRMLLLDGATGLRQDLQFRDFPSLLSPRDLLVFNDTRVIPARVFGVKESGGRVEILLERALDENTALVHLKGGKSLRTDAVVKLPGGHSASMQARRGDLFQLRFSCGVVSYFETVYARNLGAIAAPTAGLHFDADMFAALANRDIRHAFVTLHVGAGTFQPVRVDDLDAHEMHEEYLAVPESTCDAVNATRATGGRVIAVGTTVVRSLETAAAVARAMGGADGRGVAPGRGIAPYSGATRIFIKPGHKFRAVDAMVTNFHLPESTLLMLCAAFVGRDALLAAYAHAVRAQYRFFSYGDAMFLTPEAAAVERA